MAKNFYMILGITRGATDDDIRSAYRRLAKAYHPDRYSGNLKSFLDVQEAYEVLADPGRRQAYDQELAGENVRIRPAYDKYVSNANTPEPLIPRDAPVNDISMTRSFETLSPSFDEVYDWLWSNHRGLRRQKHHEVRSLTMEVPITAAQARTGGQARVYVPARATCPSCRGRGVAGHYECPRCVGEGCIVGEFLINVGFPAGLSGDHTVLLSLDRFGIRNLYLSVLFRLTSGPNV